MPVELSGGDASLYWKAGIDEKDLVAGLKRIDNNIEALRADMDKTAKNGFFDRVKNSFGIGAATLGFTAATGAIASFGKEMIATYSEFQKMEAVLTNTLGSSSASRRVLNDLSTFAAQTPFALAELTESYIKLANRGIRPTMEDMRSLGDLASSQGKSFDQLTEAILDATTGEFERLKEFGIRAKVNGDKVSLAFKGITLDVNNTEDAIKSALLEFGKMEGVVGGMQRISQTVSGQLSNLGDNWDRVLTAMGKKTGGFVFEAASHLNTFLDNLVNAFKSTEDKINEAADQYAGDALKSYNNLPKQNKVALYEGTKLEIVQMQKDLAAVQKGIAEMDKNWHTDDWKPYKDAVTRAETLTYDIAKEKALLESIDQQSDNERKAAKIKADNDARDAELKAKESLQRTEGAVKQKRQLLKQLIDLNNENRRSLLTDDEAEIQGVKDKYATIREAFKQHNLEVIAISQKYKLPVNKAALVNVSAVAPVERRALVNAENNIAEKNEISYLENDLAKKKQLYADYENYRSKLGDQAAKKEYADLLQSGDSLQSYLQTVLDSIPVNGASEQMKKFKESVVNTASDTVRQNGLKMIELLKSSQSYEQQRLLKTEEYEKQRKAFIDVGRVQEAATLDQHYKEGINALDDANVQNLDAYKALYGGIEDLSISAARIVIVNANSMLDKLVGQGRISKELALQIRKSLKDATQKVDSKLPQQLSTIAGQMSNLASLAGNFDEALGKSISTIGNIVGGVSNLQTSMSALKEVKKGDILGGISGGLGFLSTGIGIVQAITSLFDNSAELREQKEYSDKLQLKQAEAVNKLLERQLALTKDIYGTERLSAYAKNLTDITTAQKEATNTLSTKYQLTGDKKFDEDIIGKINEQGVDKTLQIYTQAGQDNMRNNILPSLSLASKSITELEKLLDEGKLDEKTSAIVTSLVDLQRKYTDTINALRAETVGTTFDAMVDDMLSALQRGEDGFESFQKSVQKSLLNTFSRNFLEKQLQPWYEAFAGYSESGGGLDKAEIEKLNKMYTDIFSQAQKNLDALQDAAGVKLIDDETTSTNTSAAGKISAAITEVTANELTGIGRGIQQNTYFQLTATQQLIAEQWQRHNQNVRYWEKNLELAIKIESNTRRSADVSEKYLPYLENIDKSSTGSLGQLMRAFK